MRPYTTNSDAQCSLLTIATFGPSQRGWAKECFVGVLLTLALLSPVGKGARAIAAGFTCTDIPASQCQVLFDLYKATAGSNWTVSNWGVNSTACGWTGITCRLPSRPIGSPTVIAIELAGNNLAGNIEVPWQDLPALQILDLGTNKLNGSLPSALGSLASLQELNLGANQLNGNVPAALGSLASLELLNLSSNSFTGTLPVTLGGLSSLLSLDVASNSLSGQLPGELGDLTNLDWLNVRDNDFSGSLPETLVNLSGLTFFWFDETYLCIPETAEFTTWLDAVTVKEGTDRSCNLCREFNEWGILVWNPECVALVELYDATKGAQWNSQLNWLSSDPSYCDWEGITCELSIGPPPLNEVTTWVDKLELPANNLAGNLPDVSDLDQLSWLDISDNPISGPLPTETTSLSLELFNFSSTSLCVPDTSEMDSWLGSISELQGSGIVCPPSAPSDVSATDGAFTDKVRLNWSDVSGEDSYQVFRCSTTDPSTCSQIATRAANLSSYYDFDAASDGTLHYYRVKACDDVNGCSDYSDPDGGYRQVVVPPPDSPTDISASDGVYTDKVAVSWTDVSGEDSYEVFRCTNSSDTGTCNRIAIPAADTTHYDDTGASADGTVHYYRVKACHDDNGCSGFSPADGGFRQSIIVPDRVSRFAPVTPCRVLDTRLEGGVFGSGTIRAYTARGSGLDTQGGAYDCGVAISATAVQLNFTAVGPSGIGYLRAWPYDSTEPTATLMAYDGESISNSVAVPICNNCVNDFKVKLYGATTHLVAEVVGYYVEPVQ